MTATTSLIAVATFSLLAIVMVCLILLEVYAIAYTVRMAFLVGWYYCSFGLFGWVVGWVARLVGRLVGSLVGGLVGGLIL